MPVPTLTSRPSKTSTHLVEETNAPTATATPAPTKILALIERQPSAEKLASYLSNYGRSLIDNCAGIAEVEPVFQDVNGDQQDDLIIINSPELTILLWTEVRYLEPILFKGDSLRGCPSSSVIFEDWTGDGISEIIFDNRALWGGTGYEDYNTTRYVIHCRASTCITVWEGLMARDVSDSNSGGMAQFNFKTSLRSQAAQPSFDVRSTGFAVYTIATAQQQPNDGSWYTGLYVITSTLSTWVWAEDKFELSESKIIKRGYEILSAATLSAQGKAGANASISATRVRGPESFFANDRCELSVNGLLVTEPFGCKQNFTTVEWKDITQDGIEDIVVIALSGAYDADGNNLTDKQCVHQRLLAFQWNDKSATPIANITGCVMREDLYGVLLKDFDNDGQTEILAARRDFDSSNQRLDITEVYKWNGTQFVFWDDVPGQP